MISKEEREKDKAVLVAATPEWKQGHHINKPRALCSARQPSTSLLAIDRETGPIFEREPELAMDLEERLGVTVPDGAEETWRTVGDVVAWAELATKGRGA